jgi:hypothetical protein
MPCKQQPDNGRVMDVNFQDNLNKRKAYFRNQFTHTHVNKTSSG